MRQKLVIAVIVLLFFVDVVAVPIAVNYHLQTRTELVWTTCWASNSLTEDSEIYATLKKEVERVLEHQYPHSLIEGRFWKTGELINGTVVFDGTMIGGLEFYRTWEEGTLDVLMFWVSFGFNIVVLVLCLLEVGKNLEAKP